MTAQVALVTRSGSGRPCPAALHPRLPRSTLGCSVLLRTVVVFTCPGGTASTKPFTYVLCFNENGQIYNSMNYGYQAKAHL